MPPSEKTVESGSALAVSTEIRLTRREKEVLALIASGLTNREIAGRLFLSPWTAQRHVANLLRKTRLNRRVELAVWHERQKEVS